MGRGKSDRRRGVANFRRWSWWLLGVAARGVLHEGQSQRKLKGKAILWNVGISPSSTSNELRKATFREIPLLLAHLIPRPERIKV